MLAILLKTLPFFAVIGLGWVAGRARLMAPDAAAVLTKFVFYFALSAMLFRFAATLPLQNVFDARFAAAYLTASLAVYGLAMSVAFLRKRGLGEAAVEAQCAVIGNTGFLGVPMLVMLLGPQAAGPVLLVLSVDLVVFSSLLTVLVVITRKGRLSLADTGAMLTGLLKNPMIVSMGLGMAWGATGAPLPKPMDEFLTLLGAAATPGALFAIGASLVGRRAERLAVAAWLSFAKLVLHPAAVAVASLLVFKVDPSEAGVMIAAAALPVAGNVFILAQHFGIAPQRVSTSILISTICSVLTVSAVIAWIGPLL